MDTLVPRVEMKDISKAFPGVQALNHVDFTVMPSEIHGLVGENGAGKSVLLKILLGVYQKDAGEIYIDGEKKEITGTAIARKEGLSAVYQDLMLAPTLSVAENICLGMLPSKYGVVNFKEMKAQAQAVCDKYKIHLDLDAKVRDLIVAQQQMVAIAKALALDCRVLVLDEPTAMLTGDETSILFDSMKTLKEQGVSIIYVSHRMEEIFEICDTATVLRDGEVVGYSKTDEISSQEMIHLMSGRNIENTYGEKLPAEGRITDKTLLSVEGLTKQNVFRDITFDVKQGEILGFFGLVGSKRTEVMRAIFGADKYTSGTVHYEDEELQSGHIKEHVKDGIGLIPEERLTQGVATRLSVGRNLNMVDYPKASQMGVMSKNKEKEIAQTYIDALDIKTPNVNQLVRNLSGGNQQKVAVGKWFNISPHLIIFDEPTSGVDVAAKLEIYNLIRDFVKHGGTAIMVSSYLPEILGVCDRVIVMSEGTISGILPTEGTSEEECLTLAFKETDRRD